VVRLPTGAGVEMSYGLRGKHPAIPKKFTPLMWIAIAMLF